MDGGASGWEAFAKMQPDCMTADERAKAGFADQGEVVIPMPVFSSDEEEKEAAADDDRPRLADAPASQVVRRWAGSSTGAADVAGTSHELLDPEDWHLGGMVDYSSSDDADADADADAEPLGRCSAIRAGGGEGQLPRGEYDLAELLATLPPPSTASEEGVAVPAPYPEALVSLADPSYRLERISYDQLTVGEFRRRAAASRCPLIITGLADALTPHGLSTATLRAALPPDFAVPLRGAPPRRAADFFDGLAAGERLYLADVPLARTFPWLLQLVHVPAYFAHCFGHRTRQRLSIAYDTPALFVGAAGTASTLHVDQMCSNFWMLLTQGRKHWTCFHPDDAPLLSPTMDVPEQIHRFRPLVELPEGVPPAARRLDFTLQAGELLYIPWGTPHEVVNLSTTCAISANYIDQTNVAATIAQGRAKLPHRDPTSARHANLRVLMDSLDEIDWPVLEDDLAPADERARPADELATTFELHQRVKYSKPVVLAG